MSYRITIPLTYYFTLDKEKIYTLNNYDTIGNRIRKLRRIKSLTAKDLGEYLGISTEGVINYEKGRIHPTAKSILILYDLFGKDLVCDEYSEFITSQYWNKLKIWRLNNSLTKKQAATILGVSEGTYLCWENQKTYISRFTFKKYKNKLKNILN